EHGDGQSRADLLPRMFTPELIRAFREFKAIWDPDGKMNPGKIVDAYHVDENLRLGATYDPPDPATHFAFPHDEYSFARSTIRCVGVGECRRESGGTMCPSFRVTKEEMHSTRGRARLLFEMLEGDPLAGGWRDPHVKEALDLCLACKGCKSDCPVHVDMATYKAEFLSHYYEGRLRPRDAYAMGLIHWWARLVGSVPGLPALANVFTQTPGLSEIAKWAGGIASSRQMPPFAPEPFTRWFLRRRSMVRPGRTVLLWPDTFNNYFFSETAQAAVDVLESAGLDVKIPSSPLCCGRPLYDFGMLDQAKRQLRDILVALKPDIEAGMPVIVLEPSCAAVFRDELLELFPHDEDAKRLSEQTFTLGAYLDRIGYAPPPLHRRAIAHGHCQQKAIIKLSGEQAILERMGLKCDWLDSGCCGMAGSFGFKAEHAEISRRIGELVVLPAVRSASAETLVLADGFSCREQIAQGTTRRALHLAEVIQMALREGADGPAGLPERDYFGGRRALGSHRRAGFALLAGAALTAAAMAVWRQRHRRSAARR